MSKEEVDSETEEKPVKFVTHLSLQETGKRCQKFGEFGYKKENEGGSSGQSSNVRTGYNTASSDRRSIQYGKDLVNTPSEASSENLDTSISSFKSLTYSNNRYHVTDKDNPDDQDDANS